MPMKIRSKELARLSRTFMDGVYQETAGWIEHLSKKLLVPRVKADEVLLDLKDVRQTFARAPGDTEQVRKLTGNM